MLSPCELIAFIATCDAPRAKHFYESTLGLRLVADEPSALVFDARGTMLRIQKAASVAPAPYTALGWKVDDIESYVEGLQHAEVRLERFAGFEQDALGIWTTPDGAKIAWFKDPDGNLLSLTQF